MRLLAPINKIIPFSTVDGPGNRTSVFFQGCNIHCRYCHNPETQNLCNNCGDCIATCKANALTLTEGKIVWNPNLCVQCDTCLQTCKHNASPKVLWMSVEEVFQEIKKNIPFIRGVTVSGGECSLYLPFLRALFQRCHQEGLTTLMDSNGFLPLPKDDFFSFCDGVMLDIKSWDEEVHQRLTGKKNQTIKENLLYLSKIERLQEIRIVVVPSLVDVNSCLQGVKEIIKDKIEHVHLKLIAFRPLGVKGELATWSSPTAKMMQDYAEYAHHLGYKNVEIR